MFYSVSVNLSLGLTSVLRVASVAYRLLRSLRIFLLRQVVLSKQCVDLVGSP